MGWTSDLKGWMNQPITLKHGLLGILFVLIPLPFIIWKDPSVITAWGTLSLTLVTACLVIATFFLIKTTKETIRGDILLKLSSDYASDDMLLALRNLSEWKRENKEDFVEKFIIERKDIRWEYDKYRRRVSHHFYQIYLLRESSVINNKFLETLAKQGKIDFLLEVVKPLELAIVKTLNDGKGDKTKEDFLKKTFKLFEQARERLSGS